MCIRDRINPSDSILGLVGFAWAGFGSAFGPIILLSLYWKRLNSAGAIAGMLTGAIVAIGWGMSPLSDVLYEIVPGFFLALIVAVIVAKLTKEPKPEVVAEFEESTKLAKLVENNSNLDFEEAAEKVTDK